MSFQVSMNRTVRQSNNLIESPYAQEFTAYEIKIFEIAVASCNASDYELINDQRDKTFSINNSELAQLLNTKPNAISMEIEKTAARIMKKTMHLRKILDDGSIEFEMINIIPFAKYKNGSFQFRLNYSILPYLIKINENFTEYQLQFLLSLSSAYSIKLYKLLYQYKNIKTRVFSIDELKEQFGIIDKYPQYKNFKQKILEPSILHINNQTDLDVSYNEIKVGRKVEKLEFKFKVKKLALPIHPVNPATDSLESQHSSGSLASLLLSIETELSAATKEIIDKYHTEKGLDFVEISIDYAKKHAKTNFDKYLSDTLVNGWAEVELKKITAKRAEDQAKIKVLKQAHDKKQKELAQYNLNKSLIEHAWNKLVDKEKLAYTDYANDILQNHKHLLNLFDNLQLTLPLSIYAISNHKKYNEIQESYLHDYLKINLNIDESIPPV